MDLDQTLQLTEQTRNPLFCKHVHFEQSLSNAQQLGHRFAIFQNLEFRTLKLKKPKYVNDYFDAFLSKVTEKEEPAIPKSSQEEMLWKERIVKTMQEYAKTLQKVTAKGQSVLLMNVLQVPDEFNERKICEKFALDRPIVATHSTDWTGSPNYESYAKVEQ